MKSTTPISFVYLISGFSTDVHGWIYITQDEHWSVQIWGGHPDDKYSEEFLPTKEERKLIYEQILEEM